jgi:hypothetical protein
LIMDDQRHEAKQRVIILTPTQTNLSSTHMVAVPVQGHRGYPTRRGVYD